LVSWRIQVSKHRETREMAARSLGRDEVRDIDRRAIEELGLPGIVLMENAGRGCAELLLSLGVSEGIW